MQNVDIVISLGLSEVVLFIERMLKRSVFSVYRASLLKTGHPSYFSADLLELKVIALL